MEEFRERIDGGKSYPIEKKREDVVKLYDEMAENGACDLYVEVDGIVMDRNLEELEESEIDKILGMRERIEEFKKRRKE